MTTPKEPLDLVATFARLLPLTDAARDEALARIARTDSDAARELAALLRHADRDGDDPLRDEDGRYRADVFIDQYRIERFVGAGGMGEVYEATEVGTVSRRVALKVMASDVANRTAEIRFANERQAMGMLEHAGVARLFGGGGHRGTTALSRHGAHRRAPLSGSMRCRDAGAAGPTRVDGEGL